MISLSKLNGDGIYINELWIETIEALPDTTITFHSGNKIVVLDPMQIVLTKIYDWHCVKNSGRGTIKSSAKKKR